MDRQFSKDISVYKKKALKGFSVREVLAGIGAIIAGCLISYLLIHYLRLPLMFTVYITGIVTAPVIYLFIKTDRGYTMPEIIKRKRELKKTSGKLPYKSYEMRMIDEMEKERKHAGKKKKRLF